jgi:hypothetical protein
MQQRAAPQPAHLRLGLGERLVARIVATLSEMQDRISHALTQTVAIVVFEGSSDGTPRGTPGRTPTDRRLSDGRDSAASDEWSGPSIIQLAENSP